MVDQSYSIEFEVQCYVKILVYFTMEDSLPNCLLLSLDRRYNTLHLFAGLHTEKRLARSERNI